jgi:DNA-directed RNA polymerase specialized sigma54-like protein
MNFNKFLKSLFGDKSTRDMKLIQPLVEKVKPSHRRLSSWIMMHCVSVQRRSVNRYRPRPQSREPVLPN